MSDVPRPAAERTVAGSADSSGESATQRNGESTVEPPRGAGKWKCVAESVRGSSHEKTGAVCQDSHWEAVAPDGALLAAIADGAGSASRSEVGAHVAAHAAIDALQRWREGAEDWPTADTEWTTVMTASLQAARDAVEREAEACGLAARDLASTLIVVLATSDLVVVAQVGDGAAVVEDESGSVLALTAPQSGEYLNETTFIVSPGAIEQAQIAVWRGSARFLAAFSDGMQMLALRMSDGTPHAPFFAPLFRFLAEQDDMDEARAQLRSFLESPRISQRADDDLTLLLAQWQS
jgi:serine/threonine protein phosphatase PrpC